MGHSKPVRLQTAPTGPDKSGSKPRSESVHLFLEFTIILRRGKMPRLRCKGQPAIYPPKSVKKRKTIVDLRVNETLQTGAVANRTYQAKGESAVANRTYQAKGESV